MNKGTAVVTLIIIPTILFAFWAKIMGNGIDSLITGAIVSWFAGFLILICNSK